MKKLDFIKIPVRHLELENNEKIYTRYSHPFFCRKLPKGTAYSDYSPTEKLIELEYRDGNRQWFDLSLFFGLVIAEVKDIFVVEQSGNQNSLSIIGIKTFKVKRTEYMKLIFEVIIPF